MRVSLHVGGFLADFVALFLQKVYRRLRSVFKRRRQAGHLL